MLHVPPPPGRDIQTRQEETHALPPRQPKPAPLEIRHRDEASCSVQRRRGRRHETDMTGRISVSTCRSAVNEGAKTDKDEARIALNEKIGAIKGE
jgi:hypothetical protein